MSESQQGAFAVYGQHARLGMSAVHAPSAEKQLTMIATTPASSQLGLQAEGSSVMQAGSDEYPVVAMCYHQLWDCPAWRTG
jgi:hypothetical protein